jgi:alkylation response protein AidB-like acyl-CoA dehydrogenase
MDYYFQEEHKIFRQGLKDFLKKEVLPNVDQWEEDGRIPKDLWKKFGEMGYLGLNLRKNTAVPMPISGTRSSSWRRSGAAIRGDLPLRLR